ncbi:MAG TPA: hypothetical protein VHW26_13515, partial [Solirubrobacteraceae bacterium]|nr:hypothetical protein [Solirubrobacteraceae bacterium]
MTYDLSGADQSPAAITTFSDGRKKITITVTDPELIGKPFNIVTVRVSEGNLKFDLLPAMTLSPAGSRGAAPKVVLPTSDK